jgi:hypothetical protein
MNINKKLIGVLVVISLVMPVVVLGCGEMAGEEEPVELEPVEVRDYEGEELSSINDFLRDNSIKGPQQIDIENYTLALWRVLKDTLTKMSSAVINTILRW